MSPFDPRVHAAVDTAVQSIAETLAATCRRLSEVLPLRAASAAGNAERQALRLAHFDLQQGARELQAVFVSALSDQAQGELGHPLPGRATTETDWESLSLVADAAVEEQVTAHRLGLLIEHECEWELRDLDASVAGLLQLDRPAPECNPVRPEIIGRALFRAIESVSPESAVRKVLAHELGQAIATDMRECYGAINAHLRSLGVQPMGLRRAGGGTSPGAAAGSDSMLSPLASPPTAPAAALDASDAARTLRALFGLPDAAPGLPPVGGAPGERGAPIESHAAGAAPGGMPGGAGSALPCTPLTEAAASQHILEVVRRLARLATAVDPLDTQPASLPRAPGPDGLQGLMAANLIRVHREELMQASSSTLDQMVIDIVASLFDQILSDTKVPPQMARLLARLQLPVLRVALRDLHFFSSRSHPVRRFVNRMASIGCAFDDFSAGPGQRFLALVSELVQQVVEGDFDEMAVYEGQLHSLEAFVEEQARDEARSHADAVALLARKEAEVGLHRRHARRVEAALEKLPLQDFMREFLQGAWSRAQVQAHLQHGADAETTQRLQALPRQLVLSAQSKAGPEERQRFIRSLPALMKTLEEGLALITWPEEDKRAFFAALLPCHAQSLKARPLSDFEYRQMDVQLRALDALRVGEAVDAPSAPVPLASADSQSFTREEAAQVGLVDEEAVDWDGRIDIDLQGLETGMAPLDAAQATGARLPAPDASSTPAPMQGASLAQCVQPGVAYQVHTSQGWQRVRLKWVSPGRSFFIFGIRRQEIISMTGRMLTRLCESGRFKAYEQAELMERAVARARRQLAGISTGQPDGR